MKQSHFALLGGVIAMAALSGAAVAADKPPEQIFRANCQTCHGQKGAGGASWINNQAAPRIAGFMMGMMFDRAVRSGFPPQMPAFPVQEINGTELSNLRQYVRNLPGSYIPEPAAQCRRRARR